MSITAIITAILETQGYWLSPVTCATSMGNGEREGGVGGTGKTRVCQVWELETFQISLWLYYNSGNKGISFKECKVKCKVKCLQDNSSYCSVYVIFTCKKKKNICSQSNTFSNKFFTLCKQWCVLNLYLQGRPLFMHPLNGLKVLTQHQQNTHLRENRTQLKRYMQLKQQRD